MIREDVAWRASRAYAVSRVPKNDRQRPREIEETSWDAWKRHYRREIDVSIRRQSAVDKAIPAFIFLGLGGLIAYQILKKP